MNPEKIAVVGGGISGISIARMLSKNAQVTVFEKNDKIGGLVRCDHVSAGLYHKLGGHVFNTKTPAVSEWFWRIFDQEKEFYHLTRDARILFDGQLIGYPLENHLYQLPEEICNRVVDELLEMSRQPNPIAPTNFKEFLIKTFGATLCETYFFPYNEKIWRCPLETIPLGWLEGKLPMPRIEEIFKSNILRIQEKAMVHARFYYPKNGGSQFIVDRLAEGLDIRLQCDVSSVRKGDDGLWRINGEEQGYDKVVYSGDVRRLGDIYDIESVFPEFEKLKNLRTRGITNTLCYCDESDVSWLYIPSADFAANRIIYTGGFSPQNNAGSRMTCVVEFLFGEKEEIIEEDIRRLPGRLERVATNHVRDAYVIQEPDTREIVAALKDKVRHEGLFLHGRFAEWEYYNIDKCIEAAFNLEKEVVNRPC